VRRIQIALNQHGSPRHLTGQLDQVTQDQLTRFQAQQQLPATGFPDDVTLQRLGLDPSALDRSNP
jgi:peptidoglycan hydrolase-like protein with peptidoglycan-binding domain